jgi:hypothetical protein
MPDSLATILLSFPVLQLEEAIPHDFVSEVGNWVVMLAPGQQSWRQCVSAFCAALGLSPEVLDNICAQISQELELPARKAKETRIDRSTTTGIVHQLPNPALPPSPFHVHCFTARLLDPYPQ